MSKKEHKANMCRSTRAVNHLILGPSSFISCHSFSMPPASNIPGKWAGYLVEVLQNILSFIVFLGLDFLETLLCIIYRCLDEFLEGKAPHCYCEKRTDGEEENELSETLYGRKNLFRQMGFLGYPRKGKECDKITSDHQHQLVNRWSDCGCESCVSWMKAGDKKLHFVVKEPSQDSCGGSKGNPIENVIFLHGFLCSSSIWTETVFQNLSESVQGNYRLFAVDLLGFGKSPKPRDSLYTLREHLDMIEQSVICPFDLKSFHLVGHSMGCIIALAVAAKYSESVKSITLVAPPYLPSSKEGASLAVLNRLAGRRLWPPLLFGAAFMSWYEHLGRCVCFVVCRNHRAWESLLKLLTRRRDLNFMIMDLPRHTHHSAWHSMHNVICGGAKYMDDFLESLIENKVKLYVIQGDRDQVIPLDCSINIRRKVPNAEITIVPNADHNSVILGREKDFTETLEQIWVPSTDIKRTGKG